MNRRWIGSRQVGIRDHQIEWIDLGCHVLQPEIVSDLMGHRLDDDLRQQDLRRVGLGKEDRLPVDEVDCAPNLSHAAEGQRIGL